MPDFPFSSTRPLDRCPGESRRANDALHDYWLLGPGRSFSALLALWLKPRDESGQSQGEADPKPPAKPPTKQKSTIEVWSSRYSWQVRIERATALQREADERKWEERRMAIRERDFEQGTKLRELADKIMAETPQFIKTKKKFIRGKGGEPDQVVIIMALDGHLMVKAAETGSKLERQAAGMPDAMTALTDKDGNGLVIRVIDGEEAQSDHD